MGRGDLVWLVG